jgi:hypothetical protein
MILLIGPDQKNHYNSVPHSFHLVFVTLCLSVLSVKKMMPLAILLIGKLEV